MYCVCLGARVSYIVCVCVLSSLEDSKFKGDLCGSGAFPADRWSFTDTGHTWMDWLVVVVKVAKEHNLTSVLGRVLPASFGTSEPLGTCNVRFIPYLV